MRKLRYLLWALVAAAVILFGVLLFQRPDPGQREMISPTSYGGPFTLTGADGQPYQSSRLDGRPHAIFFGFTNCADVCPTTLARLVRLRKQLGGGEEQPFEILFVSVDPERDRPEDVGKYAELFDSPVIGLTGSPTRIEQVKKQYGIYSEKQPTGDGAYNVNHTATVLLFDGKGDFIATISPEEPDSAALDKLRRISA